MANFNALRSAELGSGRTGFQEGGLAKFRMHGAGGLFKLHPSPVIKADRIRLTSKPVVVNGVGHGIEPKILLHRRNNVVESAEIVCSCGEHILLECEYGDVKSA